MHHLHHVSVTKFYSRLNFKTEVLTVQKKHVETFNIYCPKLNLILFANEYSFKKSDNLLLLGASRGMGERLPKQLSDSGATVIYSL